MSSLLPEQLIGSGLSEPISRYTESSYCKLVKEHLHQGGGGPVWWAFIKPNQRSRSLDAMLSEDRHKALGACTGDGRTRIDHVKSADDVCVRSDMNIEGGSRIEQC